MVSKNTEEVVEDIFNRGSGTARRRSFSSTLGRLHFDDEPQSAAKSETVRFEPVNDVSGFQNSLSAHCQASFLKNTCQTNEMSPHAEKMLGCPSVLFTNGRNFSPENAASVHHSTPDDRDSASQWMSGAESESMYMTADSCAYDDIDTSAVVRNTLSWHDSLNIEPGSSRSCISLDDSLFLRELNVDGSNEAEILATCTAVSSLEQLEQEVAGVLSDCGEMERCFGVLRRRDSTKAVVGRYSLGVADSVLAADKCGRWQESIDSPSVGELSLSSSVGIVRHSGFLWDDDGFSAASPSTGFVQIMPVNRRATRSLSPLPVARHPAANCRASLDTYTNPSATGNALNWTDSDTNTSADLALCSVYDVNRRLSGLLQVQHVND